MGVGGGVRGEERVDELTFSVLCHPSLNVQEVLQIKHCKLHGGSVPRFHEFRFLNVNRFFAILWNL